LAFAAFSTVKTSFVFGDEWRATRGADRFGVSQLPLFPWKSVKQYRTAFGYRYPRPAHPLERGQYIMVPLTVNIYFEKSGELREVFNSYISILDIVILL
jgi:hypothetical protein